MEQFTFSELNPERLGETLALIYKVFLEYEAPDYSDEGIQEFMRFTELSAIKKMLAESVIRIWTCEYDGKIIGALGARSDHINLLFVNGKYHRKGIARQLLNMMIEYFSPIAVTVNSSPYAVEAYRRLGFVDTDAEKIVNGLRFIPMKRTEVGITRDVRLEKADYWLGLAKEDIRVAKVLLSSGKFLYFGFMCHLAVEKALRAIIENSGETPIKSHNLIRLAELGGILDSMSSKQTELLDTLNPLHIEARHRGMPQIEGVLSVEQCYTLIQQVKEMIQWIEQQL